MRRLVTIQLNHDFLGEVHPTRFDRAGFGTGLDCMDHHSILHTDVFGDSCLNHLAGGVHGASPGVTRSLTPTATLLLLLGVTRQFRTGGHSDLLLLLDYTVLTLARRGAAKNSIGDFAAALGLLGLLVVRDDF